MSGLLRRPYVVLVVSVVLLGNLLTSTKVEAQQPAGQCEAGENTEQGPPPPPGSNQEPECEAAPTSSEDAPNEPKQPAGGEIGGIGPAAVTPTNRFWLGIEESGDFPVRSMAGTLNVVNPSVDHSTGSQFLTQRGRVTACSTGQFLELGWAEVGWRSDAQYIYSYDSINNQWRWYDQYSIGSGSRVTFQILHLGNGDWSAEIWWNGQWQRLSMVNLGNDWGCTSTAHVEISTQGTNRQFPFPSIKYGDGSHTYYSMGLQEAMSGNYRVWDTSIPTQENVTSEAGYYTTTFSTRYSNFNVNSNNQPPSVSVSVSPSSGDRSTNFSASVSASDTDGDTLNSHWIDWGDGSFTSGSSGTYRYNSAGTYSVRGYACDMWNTCTWSPPRQVTVAFSNSAPVISLVATPPEGTAGVTEFVAELSGYDPEEDSFSYQVDWGDGTTTSGNFSRHRYVVPGTYNVRATATDDYGASSSAEDVVSVCAVSALGACVRPTPPSPSPPPSPTPPPLSLPDPCHDFQQCEEPPVSTELPEEVAKPIDELRDAIPRTPKNTILVVDANVEQIGTHRSGYVEDCGQQGAEKDCGATARKQAFAQRVLSLGDKARGHADGDGMAMVPDVLLLQEVRRDDAAEIAGKLSDAFDGNTFKVGAGRDDPNIPLNDADNPPPDGDRNKVRLRTDVAIVYNTTTMKLVDKTHVDNKYDPEYRCNVPQDIDLDGLDDCEKATWKRHYLARLVETKVGTDTTLPTGASIGVATLHYINPGYLSPQAEEERLKTEWTDQITTKLRNRWPGLDQYVIAGDFNIERCTNDRGELPGEEGEYTASAPCGEKTWWTDVTSQTNEASKRYVDANYDLHGDTNGIPDDERMEIQYRDGCDDRDLQTQDCIFNFNQQRIDFIFTRRAELLATSRDLTCGVDPSLPNDIPETCDNRFNPYRYSDHRLQWALIKGR